MSTAPPFDKLLLTGAAGTLGKSLAPALRPLARELVLSDLAAPLAGITPGEGMRAAPCDLADRGAMRELLQGVNAVVHLGGVSYEKPFDVVLGPNIIGLFNLYEAARLAGTKRIVFASSNHVTGCYEVTDRNSPTDPPRPDGYYGLSKLYGEGVASMYWDRFGIETVCLRIGSGLPEPIDRRTLSTWLALPDLAQLVTRGLLAPDVGFLVAFGMSRNTRGWWNTQAAWDKLGYRPEHDSEVHAAQVEHIVFPPGSPQARCQGGIFLDIGPFDDPS